MKKKIHAIGKKIKGWYFRQRYQLKNVDSTFYMGGKSTISKDLKAGEYVYIGPNSIIYPKVSIGTYTLIANNVFIVGSDHRFDKPGIPIIFSGRETLRETKIGRDVWVGANTIIMTGITIGDATIIAAGSVVTKDLEPFSIYAGVPAKKIKNRFESNESLELHKWMLNENPKSIAKKYELIGNLSDF